MALRKYVALGRLQKDADRFTRIHPFHPFSLWFARWLSAVVKGVWPLLNTFSVLVAAIDWVFQPRILCVWTEFLLVVVCDTCGG